MELATKSAWQLKRPLDAGEISSVEIKRVILEQIRRRESSRQAFVTLKEEVDLISEADQVDLRCKRCENIGVLAKLPVAVKDNICTKRLRTTRVSTILSGFGPPYGATVIHPLREADGSTLRKTNMDEF